MKRIEPLFCGILLCHLVFAQDTNNCITLAVKPNQDIYLGVAGLDNNTYAKIVSGSWDTTIKCSSYPVQTQDIVVHTLTDKLQIYGNIVHLRANKNYSNITGFDISCAFEGLMHLNLAYNEISSVDLSTKKSLNYIYLYNNLISEIKIYPESVPYLQFLIIDSNNLSTEQIDRLMCNLPDRTGLSKGILCIAYDENDPQYESFLSTNYLNAIDKNFSVVNTLNKNLTSNGEYQCSLPLIDITDINIEIFPNPTSSVINIQSDEFLANLILTDITGHRLLKKHINSNHITIPTDTLPKGVFLLQINTKTHAVYKYIVVE